MEIKKRIPKVMRFRYIILPQIIYYISGKFIIEFAYNFLWVVVLKKSPVWGDAGYCKKWFCRFCGKNIIK